MKEKFSGKIEMRCKKSWELFLCLCSFYFRFHIFLYFFVCVFVCGCAVMFTTESLPSEQVPISCREIMTDYLSFKTWESPLSLSLSLSIYMNETLLNMHGSQKFSLSLKSHKNIFIMLTLISSEGSKKKNPLHHW